MASLLSSFAESWRDALRDMVLIVIAIVIAFALDAWWESRVDRSREEAHLQALLSEFQATSDRLEDLLNVLEGSIEATYEILELMGPSPPDISPDVLGRLLNRSLDVGLFSPEGGALYALLASGELALLRNDSLSVLLAGWPVLADAIRIDSERLAQNRNERISDGLLRVGAPASSIARLSERVRIPEGKFRLDPHAILGDVGLERVFVSRARRSQFLERKIRRALASTEEIIRHLVAGL